MQTNGVEIRNIRVLRGPNLFAYKPILQITLDIGPYEEKPSNVFPGFVERLTAWLPGLAKDECSVGRPGGFIERLKRGTYLGHISEHVCLELQNLMGFKVGYGRARGTGETGVYNIAIAYKEEIPAIEAYKVGLRLTLAAMHDQPFDLEGELEKLQDLADEYRYGPSTQSIVDAARARRIPVVRLTPTANLVQLGYGKYQKRIQASETSNTSSIAVEMCQEKPLTNRMLRTVGVPVPEGRSVSLVEEAWETAREIGLPVVLKPEAGNQGKGVSVNLSTETEVRAAFEIAASYGGDVLVEQYIQGQDYRLLVVNGRMVAAARRDPAQVTGDGQHNVRELVDILNADPRRRPGHSGNLSRVRLDSAVELVLQQQNMTLDSVPEAGKTVRLRQNCNLSTGGTATDVTDEVHPQNAQLAELAAQILALDIAGIDVLCQDIRRPLQEQNGAIVEVNAAPGLRMHLHPASGQPRDVGKAIVDMLYPENAPSRIPLIAVTGTNGKTTVTRLIAHIFETAHRVVGMTSTEGTYIGKERILEGDCSGPKSARAILLHPNVEVAVLETARGGILREGLAFDWCSVGVVTNLSSDHLGMGGINTMEQLAQVKQVVIESVSPDGTAVLNAEDPLVAEMAAATDARVVYFSLNPNNHIVQAHLADGAGSCVFVENGMIILAHGRERIELVELNRLPFTVGGKIAFQVQNALAAVAAAWSSGLNPAMIARALTTFKSDIKMSPGRFNLIDINGIEVIFDYGHNEAALKALADAVTSLGHRHTLHVIGLPGDRRDEDLKATILPTLAFADEYLLHDLEDTRGRARDEVPHLLQKIIGGNRPSEIFPDEHKAIIAAWRKLKPGDRLVITADIVDNSLKTLESLTDSLEEEGACSVWPDPEEVTPSSSSKTDTTSGWANAAGATWAGFTNYRSARSK